MASEKSAETRRRLVDTALRLFRTDGYSATTMRRIANEAGVSLGNAYYYFEGKDELVHELYRTIQIEHRDRLLPLLRDGAPLAENYATALHTGLDVMQPYHGFGTTFVHLALPATSRSSPFSTESQDARAMAVDLMEHVVRSSDVRGSSATIAQLPTLLWLAYLGVTLHWVADGSADQRRTRILADGAPPIIGRLVALSRVPGGRALTADVLRLVSALSTPTERNSS